MAVMFNTVRSLILLVGMALLGLPLAAQSETPQPIIPEAKARFSDAQGCVEPTEEMRKRHFEFILHQRDKTMHEGIRTRQHALEECINCHVPEEDKDGNAMRISSPEHFCSSCHTYAAVKIDCFQCHADRPVKQTSFHPLTSKSAGKTAFHHNDNVAAASLSAGTLEVLSEEGKLP